MSYTHTDPNTSTTSDKPAKKKLSLASQSFMNQSFQSSGSATNNKPYTPNAQPVNNRNPIKNEKTFEEDCKRQETEEEAQEKKKKKKKNKKKKKEGEVAEHPWAKPLKKQQPRTAEEFVEKKFAKIASKEEKKQFKNKFNMKLEEIKEDKNEGQKPKKPKLAPDFVRIRDIISQHHSKRKIPEQPKKLDVQKMKELLGIRKKKKLSKLKKAKLKYIDFTMRYEKIKANQINKSSNSQEDDGYETIEEPDNKEILQKPNPAGLNRSPESKSPTAQDETQAEAEDFLEQYELQLAKYSEILPELRISVDKRPQTVYNTNLIVREWVDHILCAEIDDLAFKLLNKLACMQVLKKLTQPSKFKKRVVCGMREVLRTVESNLINRSSQCIIVAINVQKNPMKDGGDEKMLEVLSKARRKNIPIVHACTKKRLGQASTGNDHARISIASITNYFGADEMYKELLELAVKKRDEFQELMKDYL